MPTLDENSVDAIVTDPPYELGFMNKGWDSSGIACNVDLWRECLRVLKPGGHLLSFGGDRTEHRMKCAIEDAGFEIRTTLAWVFGSGFPKSLNITKKLNSILPANLRCVCEGRCFHKGADFQCDCHPVDDLYDGQLLENQDSGQDVLPSQGGVPEHSHDDQRGGDLAGEPRRNPGHLGIDPLSNSDCQALYDHLLKDSPKTDSKLFGTLMSMLHDELMAEHKKDFHKSGTLRSDGDSVSSLSCSTPPIDSISRIYHKCQACNKYFAVEGIGTALKPAMELICMARKPLSEKTIATNVLKWGTGGINIDGCRVDTPVLDSERRTSKPAPGIWGLGKEHPQKEGDQRHNPQGRFPANLILSYPEDEYMLREDVKPEQLIELGEWLNENA